MKYLDFSLPSGNLWYFPTQIQWLSDLTDEERSRIPTKEDYQELWDIIHLDYVAGKNYTLYNPANMDCKAIVFPSQNYAISLVNNALFRVTGTHVPTCKMTVFGLDFNYHYWDTPCIIPQIIKKHV